MKGGGDVVTGAEIARRAARTLGARQDLVGDVAVALFTVLQELVAAGEEVRILPQLGILTPWRKAGETRLRVSFRPSLLLRLAVDEGELARAAARATATPGDRSPSLPSPSGERSAAGS